MKLTFIGATRQVTGSQHLFEHDGNKFLVECGLYQGHREESERINRTFAFKPRDLQSVVLSHAHLDHSGNIPTLVKRGFGRLVTCTPATKDIVELLLQDSARLQENDMRYFNKRQQRRGLPTKEPLYTTADADAAIKHLHTVPYGQVFAPVPGVKASFHDAGHILGSAQVLLEANGTRVLFSGDLGRPKMPIIRDPEMVPDIDYLIMESTYGGRQHESFDVMTGQLRDIVLASRKSRSKVIIPAFAVERTQLLLTMLKQLARDGALQGVPVYLDSPLASNVTEVFRSHPECYDKETLAAFQREDPFEFENLRYIRTTEESKLMNDRSGPMIIVSASGMCEGGRVLHHLIHSLEHESTTIILTGFQARGTLGRKLLDGAREVPIFGEPYPVRAQIHFMSGLSAHADQTDLIAYVQAHQRPRLKHVYLVHGEETEASTLCAKLQEMGVPCTIPESLTTQEF